MSNINPRALLLASAIATCVLSGTAFAQTSGPAQPAPGAPAAEKTEDAQTRIEDIVVTARRRSESLQSTPVTVTAFTGAQLQERGIADIRGLMQATPGVNFDAFPRSAPRPFFRGIGSSNQGAGGDPSSVAFLDGVYLGRAGMLAIDFYDMERVEVLKGPQGTLFGKNVVGGAINFITAKPKNELAATAQITIGQYEQLNGRLMVNVPLAKGIATRLVIGADSNGGFRHTPTGLPLDDDGMVSARWQTMFGIGSGTTFLIEGDINSLDTAQGARYNVAVLPFRTTGKFLGYDDSDKPRIANPDHIGFTNSKTGGVRGELNTDIPGFATLTATGAWRTLKSKSLEDFDGTTAAQNALNGVAVSGIQTLMGERADSYSGEARLTSLGSGPFSWVFGLYYNHDDIWRQRESQTSATPTTINQYTALANNTSYAAYGEVQYKFDFGLRLFGGARYTDEKKSYEITRLTGSIATPVANYTTVGSPGRTEQKLVTYRAGVDFRINPNIFLFGSVSTGFKSGAFQEQPTTAILARAATAPEKVTNYEIGFKTDWFDRRMRFNVSAFIAKYKDFQTIKVVPDATGPAGTTRVTVDTGDATIKGVETELVLAPTSWVDLTARYTYMHPFFDRLIQTSAILANGSPVFLDLKGMRLSRTPINALNVDLGLSTPKTKWGWLRAVVTMDYQSDVYDNNANDFIEYRRPRTLWDASLTYNISERFSAMLWVHNLTDVEYRTHESNQANGLFVQYGPPRQVGLTLNAKF